jgi:hypothetical protein
MKLCIEGDIYFIPKFHILETGTVKLSIETGLIFVGKFSNARNAYKTGRTEYERSVGALHSGCSCVTWMEMDIYRLYLDSS